MREALCYLFVKLFDKDKKFKTKVEEIKGIVYKDQT